MAERIVDLLEAVEIEHQNGERLLQPALPRAGLLDLLDQCGAVGEPGQRVVMRQKRDALLGFLPLGNVLDDGDDNFASPWRS